MNTNTNIQTISREWFEAVSNYATKYEENYGKWGKTPESTVAIFREAFESRNEALALIVTGKATLI